MSAPIVQTLVAAPAVIGALLDLQQAIVDELQPVTPADTPVLAPLSTARQRWHVSHDSVICFTPNGCDSFYRRQGDLARDSHPGHWFASLTRRDQHGRDWGCIDPTPLVVDDFGFLVPVSGGAH